MGWVFSGPKAMMVSIMMLVQRQWNFMESVLLIIKSLGNSFEGIMRPWPLTLSLSSLLPCHEMCGCFPPHTLAMLCSLIRSPKASGLTDHTTETSKNTSQKQPLSFTPGVCTERADQHYSTSHSRSKHKKHVPFTFPQYNVLKIKMPFLIPHF